VGKSTGRWRDALYEAIRQSRDTTAIAGIGLYKHISNAIDLSKLNEAQYIEVLGNCGVKTWPRPKNIPSEWIFSVSRKYLNVKFENPHNALEYVIVIPPHARGRQSYIIHHLPNMCVPAEWFEEILPQLDPMLHVKDVDKKAYEFVEKKMLTEKQVVLINDFFLRYRIPVIEGICRACFRVSLPKTGFGLRYQEKSNHHNEVRFCPGRKNSLNPSQQRPYVTQKESNKFLSIDESITPSKYGYTTDRRLPGVHIPYEKYDFNQLWTQPCQCKRNIL